MSMARTTPAQKPRGFSSNTRLVAAWVSVGWVASGSIVEVVTSKVYRDWASVGRELNHYWCNQRPRKATRFSSQETTFTGLLRCIPRVCNHMRWTSHSLSLRTAGSNTCCPLLRYTYTGRMRTSFGLTFGDSPSCSLVRCRHSRSSRFSTYRLDFSICSACFTDVSVSFAPLSIRAISSVRSTSVISRILVRVLPDFSVFSIKK